MDKAEREAKIETIKTWLDTGSINIFGLPFAGKDTHGKELAEMLDGVVIGGGDIIRSNKEFALINDHINTGALAPTEDYMRIILPYFSKPEFKERPLILSSVGRWHGEEAGVLEASAAAGHPLLVVIYLNISVEELRKRWQAARDGGDRGERRDDAEQVLDKRIDEFQTKTIPVINFYRDQGMLIEVNGLAPVEEVTNEILRQLMARAGTA
jgi:adenylate kinase